MPPRYDFYSITPYSPLLLQKVKDLTDFTDEQYEKPTTDGMVAIDLASGIKMIKKFSKMINTATSFSTYGVRLHEIVDRYYIEQEACRQLMRDISEGNGMSLRKIPVVKAGLVFHNLAMFLMGTRDSTSPVHLLSDDLLWHLHSHIVADYAFMYKDTPNGNKIAFIDKHENTLTTIEERGLAICVKRYFNPRLINMFKISHHFCDHESDQFAMLAENVNVTFLLRCRGPEACFYGINVRGCYLKDDTNEFAERCCMSDSMKMAHNYGPLHPVTFDCP